MKSSNGHTILVVEDEDSLSQAVSMRLSSSGFRVLRQSNGHEGLACALKERPDLILLDIVMPVMDGMEMLSALRKDEWGKDVPVILLSNLSDPSYAAGAIEFGVFDFLVKSDWSLDDLCRKICQHLGC
ncbi:MAG: response regulator [Candidatus Moranbacteria bacterium]|nr:response regulator [Candidatus Moranbacteria bacterium]